MKNFVPFFYVNCETVIIELQCYYLRPFCTDIYNLLSRIQNSPISKITVTVPNHFLTTIIIISQFTGYKLVELKFILFILTPILQNLAYKPQNEFPKFKPQPSPLPKWPLTRQWRIDPPITSKNCTCKGVYIIDDARIFSPTMTHPRNLNVQPLFPRVPKFSIRNQMTQSRDF